MSYINRKKSSKEQVPYRQLIPMSVAMSEFGCFLESDLGQQLIDTEHGKLDQIMPGLTGYNCLQVSVQKAVNLCHSPSVGHIVQMGYAPNVRDETQDSLWADYQSFPIANDCIDIALLHHVLEFAVDPAQLLRETDRTLTAGGHLLIMGFNPVSAWPLYQRYLFYTMRHSRQSSYMDASLCNKPVFKTIRQGRLADWLSVLNYDVLMQERYFFRPPINSERWLSRMALVETASRRCRSPFGMAYLTLARKRSTAVNPLMQDWRYALRRPKSTAAMREQTGHHKSSSEKSMFKGK